MIDITYFGQACFKIRQKNISLVIDPFNPEFTGLKLPKIEAELVLCTHNHLDHHDVSRVNNYRLLIDGPGEYEAGGCQITGINSFHDQKNGQERGLNTIYKIINEGITIVHLGDLAHKLTDAQVEELNSVDILMIPVGGTYTLDSHLAKEVISQLEPLLVIPMHYRLPGVRAELDLVETFLKEMGQGEKTGVSRLSISKDKLPEKMEIMVFTPPK